MGKNIKIGDGPTRKRGRPAGKDRIPLSKAERLARNAQYEKERREEIADAMADLADAIGCDSNMRNLDLLATVVQFIESRAPRTYSVEDADSLRSENQKLEEQISCLEQRLTIRSQAVPMHPMLGSPPELQMQTMLPTPPSLPQDVGLDFASDQTSTQWTEPADVTSRDVEDGSARTRGYSGFRKTKPKRHLSVGLQQQVDSATSGTQQTWPVQLAAVETRSCCHQLFSDECLEQCLGMQRGADLLQHPQPVLPLLPQATAAAAMEVDLASECLSAEGSATSDPAMQQTFSPTEPEYNETILPILPSEVLAFIQEYTSRHNPE